MYSKIKLYCDERIKEFASISAERKAILEKIAKYISKKKSENKAVQLVYVCTHNSRRSHFGQVWAKVASVYFSIGQVNTFSGGTEATAFNQQAIDALERIGFNITKLSTEKNARYHVAYHEEEAPIMCFSKVYNDVCNPISEFAAIMTCSEAEENCPLISGVELRIGASYDDPKLFDNAPQQDAKYDERCRQIAVETFYVFSKV
jgi:arsenate reductase (thioredoxin)